MAGHIQRVKDADDLVFLTGASGFVGSHVLRALLAARYRVRALVHTAARSLPSLEGCTLVQGDILRPGELVHHMAGCRYLIHVASLYSFLPAMRNTIFATNVYGSAGILEAAQLAGIELAIITSSSSTVGPSDNEHLATEDNWDTEYASSAYHRSKLQQARIALASQVPVILILPTAPVGPGDWKPTPTGKMIVDFMRGRIFATLNGGLNIVAVEDVAKAHVLALQYGRCWERYLIGGENGSLSQLWESLAEICGRRAPKIHIPFPLALTLGLANELYYRIVPCRVAAPLIPLEGVRMARHHMYVSCAKAQSELGYRATPVIAALERAVRWYYDHGYAR
ncbi:NAD-dependent epimerase/dehydratase family protein [Ktedonosporobacter rubrisoli]|nr:NAD-dependent epimerase/dehydratase family protein [Ktedonosporobacter rubrisoli]